MSELTRHGNFSSSGIWQLMEVDRSGKNFGKPALTYIQEKRDEIDLGRPLKNDVQSRETSWGKIVQQMAFNRLGINYEYADTTRLVHPTISNWVGIPDVICGDAVGDIKCPFSLKVFCDKLRALNGGVEIYKDKFPEDYWQLISNAILTGSKFVEAIIYVPFKEDLEVLREAVSHYDGDQNEVAWINWAPDSALPHLIKGMKYTDINIHRFEASEEDKELLTATVLKAVEDLKK